MVLYGNAAVSRRFASLLPALSVHYSFGFPLPPLVVQLGPGLVG
jgi:hypothetical protein